jgi:ATP/ADP translocase
MSHFENTKSISFSVLIKVTEIVVSFVLHMYIYISKHFIRAPHLLIQISKLNQTSKQQKEKVSPFQRIGQSSFLHVTDVWESR